MPHRAAAVTRQCTVVLDDERQRPAVWCSGRRRSMLMLIDNRQQRNDDAVETFSHVTDASRS